MAVYVDELFVMESRDPQAFRVGQRTGHQWCHMWAGGDVMELHSIAAQIGMRLAWFQKDSRRPHYDLTPSKRSAAIRLGAVVMPARNWAAIVKRNLELLS